MLAIWVKVRIKPEQRQRFLQAIEADALGSERDEPGCLRFNVLQDGQDQNVYYFYEVYKDEAALEAHRAAPHYAIWRAAADTLHAGLSPKPSVLGQGVIEDGIEPRSAGGRRAVNAVPLFAPRTCCRAEAVSTSDPRSTRCAGRPRLIGRSRRRVPHFGGSLPAELSCALRDQPISDPRARTCP